MIYEVVDIAASCRAPAALDNAFVAGHLAFRFLNQRGGSFYRGRRRADFLILRTRFLLLGADFLILGASLPILGAVFLLLRTNLLG